ncbi:zinc finger, CCHC-type containing protein [Tanacetum coccineum]
MVVTAMKYIALNFVKLDKFKWVDFRRWKRKMHFLLYSMSVVYVLTTLMPEDGDDNPIVEQVRKRAKWDNDDYVCRGLILNGMSDPLFDIYHNVESFKELWDSLEAKYMVKDASSKKFLVSNFINYKMTDSRPVLEQYNELLGILGRLTQHKMNMDEAIQVSCVIDKLPPFWKDFKHTLKHKKEELTLVELGSHLRIEESLRVQDSDKPKGNNVAGSSVVNIMEHNNSTRYNDNKGKRKHHDNTRDDPNKKAKPTCWKCGKTGYIKRVCKGVNVGNKANSSGTKGLVDGSSNSLKGHNMFNKSLQFYYVTYVSEAYFVQDDDVAWWVDSGETVHVCKDRYLRFSSGKIVSLLNVLDVPNKRKNLVSISVLKNCGYKQSVGIIHETTAPYTSQQNGISERKNRVPNKRNKITPYELWTKRKPNLNYLKVWGCRAVVRLPDLKLKNLGERGIECIFVRYAEHSKAFRFYVIEPNDSVSIKSIIESKDVIFDENRLSSVPRLNLRISNRIENIGGSVVPKEDDPKTFDEAMKSQDIAFWKEAINDDMDSITGNNTWVLADLPPGINYFDTYAPMVRISTIRLLIDMASIHNLIIHQMDVKTAFLNGELEEEIYINQPQGFILPGNENKACKLIKSLYRLKQAPKKWHQKFDEVVLSNGYLLNQADKCVYNKFDETGILSSMFSMKDTGEADVILGIRIKHESNGIAISQSYYNEKVLKKFNYFECTPVSPTIDTSEKLMPNNGQDVSQLEYSRVIGCLMYAMTCIRHDIAFAVGKLSRYTSNPGTQQWQEIQRVLKYLNKNMDYRLTYSGYPSVLEAAGKEAKWLKNLLLEIPLWSKPIAPISIRYDSVATLAKAYSQMYNEKSRHLGVSHSMIHELIMNGWYL